jgi:hypothetical protein
MTPSVLTEFMSLVRQSQTRIALAAVSRCPTPHGRHARATPTKEKATHPVPTTAQATTRDPPTSQTTKGKRNPLAKTAAARRRRTGSTKSKLPTPTRKTTLPPRMSPTPARTVPDTGPKATAVGARARRARGARGHPSGPRGSAETSVDRLGVTLDPTHRWATRSTFTTWRSPGSRLTRRPRRRI